MKSLLVLLLVWLAGLMCSPTSRAFVDPPTFVPEVPVAGQPVQMFIRVGVCHTFSATFPPRTPRTVVIQGDRVEVVLDGASEQDPILCNFPIGISQWNLGTLPAGQYTLEVRIRNTSPPFTVFPVIAESTLTVVAAPSPPRLVPVSSTTGMILLALLVTALAARALKRCGTSGWGLVVVLAVWPMSESAAQQQNHWIFLELSRSGSAPSPESLVEARDASTGRALLIGLDAEPPEGISYFVPPPYRARGDFKAYL